MTLPAPTYDLVMLLDPQAEEATRAKILTDTRAAIEAQGELLRQDDWGDRTLTYPIDHMLSALDRTLRITDGIMRFRIIKLKPGVPDAPDVLAAPAEEPQGEPEVVEAVAVAEPGAEGEVEVIAAEAQVADVDSEVGEPA
jgi:small subunit ribosomal protein S6